MIYKSIYASPLGYLEICADTPEAISRIYFTSSPAASYTESPLTKAAALQLEEYFKGQRRAFDFPMQPEGTAFQKQVWQACRDIPYAQTKTYKQLAEAIGDDKAARAVGNALNSNPILIAIPCHRVIGRSNFLSGFAAGAAVKEALLGAEKNFLKLHP